MSLVIVGASLAGLHAARAAREAGYDGRIQLVGDEPVAPYDRPPLSKALLQGGFDVGSLALEPAGFYASFGIELELGRKVTAVSPQSRRITFADGAQLSWSRLVIATGASPRRLLVPGASLEGVCTLRSVQDAVALEARLGRAEDVVVIGAGVMGIEVAAAARARGARVSVVDRAPHPLARLAHPVVGAQVARRLSAHGLALHPGCAPIALHGQQQVEAVTLSTGVTLPADLVVVAMGVAPNVGWLEGSGVELEDGVRVDEGARTNVPGIFAAGDVTRSPHPRLGRRVRLERCGHARTQGRIAGRGAAGISESYVPELYGGTRAFGDRYQFAGLWEPEDELLLRGAEQPGAFITFGVRGGKVRWAFAMNRPEEMTAIRKWLDEGTGPAPHLLRDPSFDLCG